MHSIVVSDARTYGEEILDSKLSPDITYHNIQHTQAIVEAGQEIGIASGLNAEELEVIELACWFHDLGYTQGSTEYEAVSAQMAKGFLEERKYPAKRTDQVVQCILVTKMPTATKKQIRRSNVRCGPRPFG